jgi:hypothetical protein
MKTSPGNHAASLSPDGKLIAVIDYQRPKDDKYGVKVWSVEQNPRLASKLKVQSPVFVQFAPLGEKLLIVTEEGLAFGTYRRAAPCLKR